MATRRRPNAASDLVQWRREVWFVLVPYVAAIAGLLLLVWTSVDVRLERALTELMMASAEERFAVARFHELPAWRRVPTVSRSRPSGPPARIQIAALQLRDFAERHESGPGMRALGIAHVALGRPDLAVAIYEDAVAIHPEDVALRTNLAAARFEQWRRASQPLELVRAFDDSARVLRTNARYAPALFNQALALTELGLDEPAAYAWQLYRQLAPYNSWTGEVTERIAVLRKGSGDSPALPGDDATDHDLDVAVEQNAGAVYQYVEDRALRTWAAATIDGKSDDIALAVRYAEALARNTKDAYLNGLVQAAFSSSAWPPARRQELAVGIDRLLEWRRLIDAGDYLNAETAAHAAFRALVAAGVDSTEAEFEIAYCDLVAERTAEARQRLAQVERQATSRGYWRVAAKALRLRALDATLATRVSEAQRYYEHGLSLATRAGDVELAALFHTFLGESYGFQGDLAAAWRHLAVSLALLPRLTAVRQRFDTLNISAVTARRAGLHEASLVFANELLRRTEDWTNPEGLISGRLSRARALAELGVGDRGVSDLARAESMLAKLDARPAAKARLTAEVRAYQAFSLAGHDDPAALDSASQAIDYFGGTVRVRLAELLLQRGRLHARESNADAAIADWTRGVAILEDQRDSLRDELLRVARTSAFWDLYGELIDHSRHDPVRALEWAERAKARELIYSLAPGQTASRVSLQEARGLLRNGMQAVVFTQLPTRLLIWSVDAQAIQLTERPVSAAAVRDLTRRFRASMQSGADSSAGLELSRLLLPPGVRLTGAPILLIPDDSLHGVPFAALPVAGNRLLVEAAIPVVAPSLSAFAIASQRPHRPSPSLLAVAVGDAIEREDLPALRQVQSEAIEIGKLYKGQARVLSNASATDAAIVSALGEADVVHFAGHAIADAQFPARSRLVLSTGELTPSDIARAGVKPGAIAVLSACETAVGQNFRGEGPMSLMRAFLSAGTSSVVATLWQIRDDDAARLMPVLHEFLVAGDNAPESLARAQRRLMAQGVSTVSWAGFSAIGGFN